MGGRQSQLPPDFLQQAERWKSCSAAGGNCSLFSFWGLAHQYWEWTWFGRDSKPFTFLEVCSAQDRLLIIMTNADSLAYSLRDWLTQFSLPKTQSSLPGHLRKGHFDPSLSQLTLNLPHSSAMAQDATWDAIFTDHRELHRMMHEANHNALVIWYDAITSEGKLQWQDNLTELNHAFFDACDGLFVNYTWKAGTPALAAKAAGIASRHLSDSHLNANCFRHHASSWHFGELTVYLEGHWTNTQICSFLTWVIHEWRRVCPQAPQICRYIVWETASCV